MSSHRKPYTVDSRTEPLILILSYDFFPATEIGARRTTELAKYLAAHGYGVAVVSSFGGRHIKAGSQILPGVIAIPVLRSPNILIGSIVALKRRITRQATTTKQAMNGVTLGRKLTVADWPHTLKETFFRVLYFVDEFKMWSWRASRAAVNAAKIHNATLIISSGPPNSALIAGSLAARTLRIPHIADLRDPWTDSVTANPKRRIDYRMQRPLESWVVRTAAHITSAGASVAELLGLRYPDSKMRISVVRNGYDGIRAPVQTNTDGKFSILFAGELYLGRDPFPILDALERLLQRPEVDANRVRITFIGRVERYAGRSLSDWANSKRLFRIMTILPHSPMDIVSRAVSESTLLLNLAQQQPYSVPAKTYEHLISGREILVICENNSETASVVKNIPGINQVDPWNPEKLEQTLLDLYRRHAIQGRMTIPSEEDVHRFSRSAANQKFLNIIKDVLEPETKEIS